MLTFIDSARRRRSFRALVLMACVALIGPGCASLRGSRAVVAVPPAPERATHVRILRDTLGIPHVFGKRDADVAFGLAWAHAEDDFATIQRSLVMARGRLGEIDGAAGARSDYLTRLLRVSEFVASGYARDLSPALREIIEAYAEGLTFYAERHRDELLLDGLLPFRGEDVIAGFVHKMPLFTGLLDVLRHLDAEGQDAAPRSSASIESPAASLIGSNAFALGPSRTIDGRTRLAINSHQPWDGPVAWYEAHLVSEEGWNVTGGLFPGSPVVLHGHNAHLGWAHTVNRPDLIDAYRLILHPEKPDEYRFDGAWRPFEKRETKIRVRLLGFLPWTVTRTLRWSVHGPVFELGHGEAKASYAFRISGHGDLRAVEQWWRMNRARNRDEWLDAMRMLAIPMFNTVYADDAGHISYVYNARLPRRAPGFDWKGVLPGDTSAALWDEVHPFVDLPQIHDPAAGFVQNANSTPWTATDGVDRPDHTHEPEGAGIETRETERSLRLRTLLAGDTRFGDEATDRAKWDQRYDGGAWVDDAIARLAAVPAMTDDEREAQRMLARWDRTMPADSREGALAALALTPFQDAHYERGGVPDPADVLREATRHLRRMFDRLDPALGDLQRLRRGTTDIPIGGGPDLLHATYASRDDDGHLVGRAGDCFVLLVTFGEDGSRSRAIHQFGSSSRPDSPHYADQASDFVARNLRPVWFTEADIRAHLEAEYRPGDPR